MTETIYKYKYECEHGVKGNHPFVHVVGPMTSSGKFLPVPPCHPKLMEDEK